MEESIKEAKLLQDQAEDLNNKFMEKKDLGWQEKKANAGIDGQAAKPTGKGRKYQKRNDEKNLKENLLIKKKMKN